jgi:hypothetical protein
MRMRIILKSGSRSVGSVWIAAALLCTLPGQCNVARAQGVSLLVASPAQLQNVGDAILAAAAYKESGAYDRDVAVVAQQAADWIRERAPSAARPALVLDID